MPPGTMRRFDLRIARLPSGSWADMPVVVAHGAHPGPVVWCNGAIHGDELNGVEITRRLLRAVRPRELGGTVMFVPIVNVFGVTTSSRYLPDRRDLNRSFPGSRRGSLAARLANQFFEKVVSRCEVGLDFHTGSAGRQNLPQLRCDLDDPETRAIAEAFAPPLLLHASLRDGSLRWAAREHGARVLLFETGEAMRFDELGIERGVAGTLRVLQALKMLPSAPDKPAAPPLISRSSSWSRAGVSGFCHTHVELGQGVAAGDSLATICDSVGGHDSHVRARVGGVVIGLLRTAIVHRGDALVHVAEIEA